MSPPPLPHPLRGDRTAALLADLRWLQDLARQLVRDPEAAADAVQDVCAIALRPGPAPVAHPRAWLATVLRNCLRSRHRAERAACEREQAAARPEACPGAADLVQRAELQQRLVGTVLRLPQHYRDVVLMRFFESLPQRHIARRLGVPVATVNSRLQRALALLRAELDRGSGGRAGWALPALGWPAPLPALPFLGVVMHTKVKVAAAVAVAAGAVTVTCFWPTSAAGADPAQPPPAAGQPPAVPSGGSGGGGPGAGPAAARRSVVAAPPALPSAASAGRVPVRGFVRDCRGAPLPGAPVAAGGDPDAGPVASDGAGAFELLLLPRETSLRIDDPRFVTVLGANWAPGSPFEPVIVAAPAIAVAGSVVDAAGAAVPSARIELELPDDFDARLPVRLDRAERGRWHARSGADGGFALGRVPRIEGARLFAAADAFRPVRADLPPGDDEALRIVLQPFAYEQGQLAGVVVDPLGTPVAGARVTMGVTSVVSDERGRFGLSLRRAGWPTAIVAASPGHLPARLPVPENGGADPDDWPDPIVLQLGQPPLSIRGRVVDREGGPVAGALVWVHDPTLLGIAGMLPLYTEYVLAGGEVPPHAARMPVPFADDPTRGDNYTDITSTSSRPSASWFFATADEQGGFELPGLLPRDYTLRALDPRTGVTADLSPVAAGGSAEIRILGEGLWPVLRGRVQSLRGEPLGGVEVTHFARMFTAAARVPGGRFEGNALRKLGSVTTGADGTFELKDVSRERSTLSFTGDRILPRPLDPARIADPLSVVAVVEARCHVEVALSDPYEADEVAVRDGDGEPVDISILRSGSHQANTEIGLHDGRSGVFVVGERAARLLLLRGGRIVREVPLALQPGTTFRVQ